MVNYSQRIKEAMVKKLTSTNAPSAMALSREVNIPQSTLSRWVREYATMGGKGGGTMKRKRPQDWTPEEKLNAILEYEKLEEEAKGEFLRKNGLHAVYIERWKEEIIKGFKSARSSRKGSGKKKIKELEKELRRKDKALAEAAALLVLKKKANDIWGDPEEGK